VRVTGTRRGSTPHTGLEDVQQGRERGATGTMGASAMKNLCGYNHPAASWCATCESQSFSRSGYWIWSIWHTVYMAPVELG
jgi:hypothetical protein